MSLQMTCVVNANQKSVLGVEIKEQLETGKIGMKDRKHIRV